MMRFDHHADDAGIAGAQLPGHVGGDLQLQAILLAAVRMREVDHDFARHTRRGQFLARGVDTPGIVPSTLPAS